MKLQDRLPDRVCVDGKTYRADLDFRNVLRLLDVLARDDLLPGARVYLALKCVMRRPPRHGEAVLNALRQMLFPENGAQGDGQKLTDFEQDADVIRAAFLQAYHIDLWHDRLHWIEFRSLLSALPEGSRYSEILSIRARPMPSPTKYNIEEREWLAKAKALYQIKMTDREEADSYARSVQNVFAGLMAWAGAVVGSDDHA